MPPALIAPPRLPGLNGTHLPPAQGWGSTPDNNPPTYYNLSCNAAIQVDIEKMKHYDKITDVLSAAIKICLQKNKKKDSKSLAVGCPNGCLSQSVSFGPAATRLNLGEPSCFCLLQPPPHHSPPSPLSFPHHFLIMSKARVNLSYSTNLSFRFF